MEISVRSRFEVLILVLFCSTVVVSLAASEDNVNKRTDDEVSKRTVGITRRKRSDDIDLIALQTLVQQQAASIQQQASSIQQQAASIQQLQNQLTASKQEFASLKASLPSFSPVGFSVGFSTDSGTGIPMTNNMVLKFDHIITNVGNHYDPITGIFTAPTAGLYTFYINFMSVINAGHTYIDINKHGTILAYAFANGNNADYDRGSTEVTTHLAQGEQVWAAHNQGSALRGGQFTIFTGFLVQAG